MKPQFIAQTFELAPSANVVKMAVSTLKTLAVGYFHARDAYQRNSADYTAMKFIDSIVGDLVFRELLRRRYNLSKKELAGRDPQIGRDLLEIDYLFQLYDDLPSLN